MKKSDVEVVADACHLLERVLRDFGAAGNGLTELTLSVGDRLPPDLSATLRRLASTRNAVVHDRRPLGDAQGFEREARAALRRLLNILDAISDGEGEGGQTTSQSPSGAGHAGAANERDSEQWLAIALDQRNGEDLRVIAMETLASARESTRVAGWLSHFAQSEREPCAIRVAAVKSLCQMRWANVVTDLLKVAKSPTTPNELRTAAHEALRSLGSRKL